MNPKPCSNPVRFAIAGAGYASRIHATALAALPQTRLTAVLDRDSDRARALAEPHGARWGTDPETVIAQPDIDAVIICTPSALHAQSALAAIAAGKHVLIEKPIDISLPAADAVIAAAREACVTVGVVFQKRFHPALRFLKDAIASGRLGRVTLAEASVKYYRSPEYFAAASWRGTWAFDGGGALINQGIHYADLLCWLLGQPQSVFASAATLVHPIETEDTLAATLRFAGGALGVLQATTTAYPHLTERLEICGTRGCATFERGRLTFFHTAEDGEKIPSYGLDDETGITRAKEILLPEDPGHRGPIADFADSLIAGRPPLVDGVEGRRSLALVTAAYESARTGREIPIQEPPVPLA